MEEAHPLKSRILHHDHNLQQQGVKLENPQRKNALNPNKLAALAAIASSLLFASPSQASPQLSQREPTQTSLTRAPQGAENSLKTALLSHRIHEALVAEHLIRGNGHAPKQYVPIHGYVNPNDPPPDSRVGRNGRIEQNIIQPADQIHPALLKTLTGTVSSAILKSVGDYAKETASSWPQNRDTLAQNIQRIWDQTQNQTTTPFRRLDSIDQEKYRRMADGVMYVTTLEKHLDKLQSILDQTHNERERNTPPSAHTVAERLSQIQKSHELLQRTPLKTLPQQALEEVLDATPKNTLDAAQNILKRTPRLATETPQREQNRRTPQALRTLFDGLQM
jgi:hypothetical protein